MVAALVENNGDEDGGGGVNAAPSSLIIPIISSTSNSNLFIEIFPEEIADGSIPVATVQQVLQDENAALHVWADAAMHFMQQKHARDASTLLEQACELPTLTERSSTDSKALQRERARVYAATGIASLTNLPKRPNSSSSSKNKTPSSAADYFPQEADQKFTQAGKIDTFYPMTWIGRGMQNLYVGKLDQAVFFFQTTLQQCGPVLPALLGMAAVHVGKRDYARALEQYAAAIRRYPEQSGAPARVGLGLACYHLGQVDRARAAFARALVLDPENVPAMVGSAILDMAACSITGMDDDAHDKAQLEKAIKLMSMAHLLDHSNAMVQNHLANHYFWKWTPVTGTVTVVHGSQIVKAAQPLPLDVGERVRIGTSFETIVIDDDENAMDDEDTHFTMRDAWMGENASGLMVWKKDYDRVEALAKGAYQSTNVEAIQGESLFMLARVYHVRGQDVESAYKLYSQACKLAPQLAPARLGMAQTLIMREKFEDAKKCLKDVLAMSPNATDALALLGLLEVHTARLGNAEEGLVHIRKAITLDPLNPELVVMEALALQPHPSSHAKALDRYQVAVDLLKRRNEKVPYTLYANAGVLCHEIRKYDEAMMMYQSALRELDSTGLAQAYTIDNAGVPGGSIRHRSNFMFCGYVDTGLEVELLTHSDDNEVDDKSGSFLVVSSITDVNHVPVTAGDLVRLGGDFESSVVAISVQDEKVVIELQDEFDPLVDVENEQGPAESSWLLSVKRENKLLDIPKVLTIAFNIARAHEAAGRTLAAIELHKALIKRNPAYVNSYLRLACIAVDCGSLKECSEWLKIAAASAPGNAEVLTLVGNLHLSLCDWKPAQDVFDSLLVKKLPNIEAYSLLSLGNIFFATTHLIEKRYSKHLNYATDFYKQILTKDPSNAYAANGLGTILAEKGEIFKAKDIFNRVREVSGDVLPDTLLNVGHILLAQKKHPEALQMYKNYMKRTEDGTTPITSKSRVEDVVDVLLYISFAYFDWARHTELSNNANAAPADGRYKEAMHYLELAISKGSKRDVVLQYNLCMTKLQAANCVLQKLNRGIPRTVEEVQEALDNLSESLAIVKTIQEKKAEGEKVPVATSTLADFIMHCTANMASAQSHLQEEIRRHELLEEEQKFRVMAAENAAKQDEIKRAYDLQEEAEKQEARDKKADEKWKRVADLQSEWKRDQESKQALKDKKARKDTNADGFIVEDPPEEGAAAHNLFGDSSDNESAAPESSIPPAAGVASAPAVRESDLFGDSDDEDAAGEAGPASKEPEKLPLKGLFDDSEDEDAKDAPALASSKPSSQDLFGDSDDDDSDEKIAVSGAKRDRETDSAVTTGQLGGADAPTKKRRVLGNSDDE